MLWRVLRLFRRHDDPHADEESRAFGAARSPKWPAERDRWLRDHPQCACCRAKDDLEVHHKIPVHVDQSLELKRSNMITLCRRCHLFVGHLGLWSSWNPAIETDSEIWSLKIRNRPRATVVAILLAALLTAPAAAQMPEPHPPGPPPAIVLPPEIKQDASGDPVCLKPTTEAKRVTWRLPANVWSRQLDGGRELLVRARTAGRYSLLALVAVGEEIVIAECVLIVEGVTPPTPPTPVDDFSADLRKLVQSETGAEAKAQIRQLAAIYRQAAKCATDETLTTAGQLLDAVRRAAESLLPSALRPIRQRVAEELAKAMPADPDATLTAELRAKAAELYQRAAKALE